MSTRRARLKPTVSIPIRKKAAAPAPPAPAAPAAPLASPAPPPPATPAPIKSDEAPSTPSTTTSNQNVSNLLSSPSAKPIAVTAAIVTAPSPKPTPTPQRISTPQKSQSDEQVAPKLFMRRIVKPFINIPGKKLIPKESTLELNQSITSDIANNVFNHPSSSPTLDKTWNASIDGIRPLSTIKPNILKNTSISDEINFDPIIPLPSSQKNRLKLKPMPRFAMRRNSCQGSASESEDETKKSKRDEATAHCSTNTATPKFITPSPAPNRNRNDSVCSLPADLNIHTNPPMTPRQKIAKWRTGTSDGIRRAIARKRALQQAPENPLTMCDLIYYNPPNNSKKSSRRESLTNCIPKPEPPKPEPAVEIEKVEKEEQTAIPVPQVKLGPNGEIVLDEQSLVIETTDAIKSRSELSKLSVVYESGLSSSSGLQRRISRSRDWSNAETLRFYKALNTIGTDFALMLSLFPGRSRRDLKVKFKKEEKLNLKLVDRALMNPLNFDITELEQQLANDQNMIEQRKIEKQTKKRMKSSSYRKSSVALRSLNMDEPESDSEISSKKKLKKNKHIEKQTHTTIPSSEAFDKSQSDASHLLPTDVEPGSMVILVNKIPKMPGHNTLQAYVAQTVDDGKTKMMPVYLESDMLMSIAKEMNILKPGEKYTMATPEKKPNCT